MAKRLVEENQKMMSGKRALLAGADWGDALVLSRHPSALWIEEAEAGAVDSGPDW